MDLNIRNYIHELQSGDIVEIQTDKNQSPKQDWFRHVKTHQASHQIKYRLRKQSSSGPLKSTLNSALKTNINKETN
ncbi:hypothetical protein HC864_05375 [Candidatus Gracilibacteria bacterium]|nr:hypothetical protein [Candidatus Gracilibacteria bacterium]